jgi:hypothetical protein
MYIRQKRKASNASAAPMAVPAAAAVPAAVAATMNKRKSTASAVLFYVIHVN